HPAPARHAAVRPLRHLPLPLPPLPPAARREPLGALPERPRAPREHVPLDARGAADHLRPGDRRAPRRLTRAATGSDEGEPLKRVSPRGWPGGGSSRLRLHSASERLLSWTVAREKGPPPPGARAGLGGRSP